MNLTFFTYYMLIFSLGAASASFALATASRSIRPQVSSPFSSCDSCQHRLHPDDLIPILSFIKLRGRCRHCGSPIPSHYLGLEIFTAFFFLFLENLYYDQAGKLLFMGIYTVFAIMFTITDLEAMILPDDLLGFFAIFCLLSLFLFEPDAFSQQLIQATLLFLIFYLFYQVLPDALGGGDIKLISILALLLSQEKILLLLFYASASALAFLALAKFFCDWKAQDGRLPFAPFIMWAGFLCLI